MSYKHNNGEVTFEKFHRKGQRRTRKYLSEKASLHEAIRKGRKTHARNA